MNRSSMFMAVCGVVLVACVFGARHGVFDVSGNQSIGVLTLNGMGEADRAYVGVRVQGSSKWNPLTELRAINLTNGAVTGVIPAQAGSQNLRAVTTDLIDDTVWTLHDDGSVKRWSKDLTTLISSAPGFFGTWSPSFSVIRMCDIEFMANSCVVASGIIENNIGTWRLVDGGRLCAGNGE